MKDLEKDEQLDGWADSIHNAESDVDTEILPIEKSTVNIEKVKTSDENEKPFCIGGKAIIYPALFQKRLLTRLDKKAKTQTFNEEQKFEIFGDFYNNFEEKPPFFVTIIFGIIGVVVFSLLYTSKRAKNNGENFSIGYAFTVYNSGFSGLRLFEVVPTVIGLICAILLGFVFCRFIFSSIYFFIKTKIQKDFFVAKPSFELKKYSDYTAFNDFFSEVCNFIPDLKYFNLVDQYGSAIRDAVMMTSSEIKSEDVVFLIDFSGIEIKMSLKHGIFTAYYKSIWMIPPSKILTRIKIAKLVFSECISLYPEYLSMRECIKEEQNLPENMGAVYTFGLLSKRPNLINTTSIFCAIFASSTVFAGGFLADKTAEIFSKGDYADFYVKFVQKKTFAESEIQASFSQLTSKTVGLYIANNALPAEQEVLDFIENYRPKSKKLSKIHNSIIASENAGYLYKEAYSNMLLYQNSEYYGHYNDVATEKRKEYINSFTEWQAQLLSLKILNSEDQYVVDKLTLGMTIPDAETVQSSDDKNTVS